MDEKKPGATGVPPMSHAGTPAKKGTHNAEYQHGAATPKKRAEPGTIPRAPSPPPPSAPPPPKDKEAAKAKEDKKTPAKVGQGSLLPECPNVPEGLTVIVPTMYEEGGLRLNLRGESGAALRLMVEIAKEKREVVVMAEDLAVVAVWLAKAARRLSL